MAIEGAKPNFNLPIHYNPTPKQNNPLTNTEVPSAKPAKDPLGLIDKIGKTVAPLGKGAYGLKLKGKHDLF
jgi:hypothetical protein